MKAELDADQNVVIGCADYDLCQSCKHIMKCPLIQAITQEIVILHYSDIAISECGLFEQRKKRRYE